MRIHVKRAFTYQKTPSKTATLQPGEYEVGPDISLHVAEMALKFGGAVVIAEVKKVAPENKVVEAPENKVRVAKKSGHRRSTRAKPKPAGS